MQRREGQDGTPGVPAEDESDVNGLRPDSWDGGVRLDRPRNSHWCKIRCFTATTAGRLGLTPLRAGKLSGPFRTIRPGPQPG